MDELQPTPVPEAAPVWNPQPGDVVRVHQRVKEANAKGEEKERIQVFEGTVIARRHRKEAGATFTVRKIAHGIGVERIFPLHAPTVANVEVTKHFKVRRAKLHHLRGKYQKKLKEVVTTSEK
ncbi:50S ribosomal protein L19 [Candidatus Uhrbacteria bacterium]|nr:50S ribosomal protein L19 [Candidatus Uhrbacteria bacterium]